jgi:hypothetical protein
VTVENPADSQLNGRPPNLVQESDHNGMMLQQPGIVSGTEAVGRRLASGDWQQSGSYG